MNLKDRKIPLIAGGAAVVVILLLLIFMPSDKSGDQGPEIISKRVKIELPEETDTAASADTTIDGATIQPSTEAVPAEQPSTVKPAETKPATVAVAESKPAAIAPAPAPTRIEQALREEKNATPAKALDAPKAVETVKTVKKAAVSTKKTAAKKQIAAGNAWALNIASFPSLSEAQNLAGKLKKGGYNAYVAGFTKDSVRWHRVRVGFFASRIEAAKAGEAIKSKFRVDKPWIAKPDAAELKAHL